MTRVFLSALRHSAFYSPYLMTIAGGFLAAEGLEPVYEPQTPSRPAVDRLRNGTCHVLQSAVATSFADLEAGRALDILHFAQVNARDGFFIAGRRPEPEFTWANLRGKRVLVDHFFQPLAMLSYGLHRQGVDYAEVIAVDAGEVTAIERAFRSGQGDYVHLQGPGPQQLQHDGIGYVVAAVGDAVGPVAFSSLCATRAWLATDVARAFMRAYRQARDLVVHAPAEEVAAREQEAGFFPAIDRRVLAQTVQAYQHLGCWEPDPVISEASYDNLLEVFLHSGLITRRHPYEAAVVPPP